ncbi:uncharacterized protein PG998_008825 [Apiospora kogelbergensis]|uniref:uncharacterized protein n=1 Tax=Apiospora kogelbergensis TaxID=1337665 RepID=UPI003130831F
MTSSSLTSSTDPANQKNPVGRREGFLRNRDLWAMPQHMHICHVDCESESDRMRGRCPVPGRDGYVYTAP